MTGLSSSSQFSRGHHEKSTGCAVPIKNDRVKCPSLALIRAVELRDLCLAQGYISRADAGRHWGLEPCSLRLKGVRRAAGCLVHLMCHFRPKKNPISEGKFLNGADVGPQEQCHCSPVTSGPVFTPSF